MSNIILVMHHQSHRTSLHICTAILKPGNVVRILVDGQEKTKVNFLSDPPLIPDKMIPDRDEKKPEDWDDKAKIPDPSAPKPDDWDEDAPIEIEDEDAVKPEGWLDDEPEEIDDPKASKPDHWDGEEDGEWEAPKIDNPKCVTAPGCGEWKRPMKPNHAFKGRWYPPIIDNPNYNGTWKPRDIPNPKHFEVDKPDIVPTAAISIEIWTMQDGILFDNILITKNEKVVKSYRVPNGSRNSRSRRKNRRLRKKLIVQGFRRSGRLPGFILYNLKLAIPLLQKKVFEVLYKVADIPFFSKHKLKILVSFFNLIFHVQIYISIYGFHLMKYSLFFFLDFIERAEKQPNATIGFLVSIMVLILAFFFMLISGGKKQPRFGKKTEVAETSNDQGGSGEKEAEEKRKTTKKLPVLPAKGGVTLEKRRRKKRIWLVIIIFSFGQSFAV